MPAFSGRFASSRGSPDGCTGGDAHQNALLVADQTAGRKGVFVGDGDDLIVDLGVQHSGDETGTDTLDLVCACNALGSAPERMHGSTATTLTPGFLLLEVLAHAGDGAAGADTCHEDSPLRRRCPPRSPGRWSQCAPWGWPG